MAESPSISSRSETPMPKQAGDVMQTGTIKREDSNSSVRFRLFKMLSPKYPSLARRFSKITPPSVLQADQMRTPASLSSPGPLAEKPAATFPMPAPRKEGVLSPFNIDHDTMSIYLQITPVRDQSAIGLWYHLEEKAAKQGELPYPIDSDEHFSAVLRSLTMQMAEFKMRYKLQGVDMDQLSPAFMNPASGDSSSNAPEVVPEPPPLPSKPRASPVLPPKSPHNSAHPQTVFLGPPIPKKVL